MTTSVGNNSVFRSFFEKQKLTGPNFIDWYRQLRLVLSTEDKKNYLEHPIPAAPVAPPGQQVPPQAIAAHAAWVKGQKEVAVLMLLTMDLEIQRNLAHLDAYDMLQELKAMYSKQAKQELLQTNYNMHGMGKTVNELHAMLKLHEESLPKKDANPALHAIRAGRVQKNHKNKSHKAGKGKIGNASNNASFASKPKTPLPPKKITLQRTPFATNVGLRGSKKLKPGALSLYVGDGHRTAVEAIRTFHLELPSGLVVVLNNCHYAPSFTRGVISVSCLFDDGFVNRFDDNNVISVSKNNLVYFKAIPRDGIYEIDMSCSNTNDSSIKKHIEKLQHDGLFNSIDIESLGKCVSCMSGKMERKPYSHQVERAKDLLGLIHANVCGPFKIVSRQGASYFVTFTDDFSRYGYVYLLKHKFEMFETFKVFQKKVENQLGKTIKSLRSDRGDTSLDHEEDDQEIDEPQSDINPIRKFSRTRHAPDRICLYIDAEEHELGDLGEPANYKAALLDPESKKWLDAMNVEMQSMKDNDTNMDGAVYIFKAHLVAKGFTQTYGVDYEETFSHVADIRAIRIFIAIAAYYDYEIWQMDVKTAFLHGHLSEEVYMEQLEGFVNPKYPNHKFSFTQNPEEPCVYIKASGSYVAILILYVDDILLMGNNIPMLQDVKSYLGRSFAMKDLGKATYILGIKIYHDRSKRLIGLCQNAYIEKIMKRFYMKNSKRGTIPMQEKLKLSKSQGASTPAEKQRMQNIPYASAVGSVMYAVRCTRPDVAFAQNMTSRFQQNPGEEHWTAVKNILKYLRNTKDMFLVYGGNMERELIVSCYTDAGYLMDADNLKSQTGYVFVLNGGVVDWKSTKQSIFATSSTDAEYIAAFDASKEAV
nr:retrotransposon protein, putative, Ty1-copia subclass [Tanacetum cinerariifolium]